MGFREEWKTEGWRNQLHLLGAIKECRGSGGIPESSRLGPAPNLSHPVSSLFHHYPSGLTCLTCYSHQSRTLSAAISLPLKVIMRIDEIMFVKEFCKHQREGAAWISRVAVSEGNHDSLLLYYLPQRPMTIAPLAHPQPGCQLGGAQNSELRSQCFPQTLQPECCCQFWAEHFLSNLTSTRMNVFFFFKWKLPFWKTRRQISWQKPYSKFWYFFKF